LLHDDFVILGQLFKERRLLILVLLVLVALSVVAHLVVDSVLAVENLFADFEGDEVLVVDVEQEHHGAEVPHRPEPKLEQLVEHFFVMIDVVHEIMLVVEDGVNQHAQEVCNAESEEGGLDGLLVLNISFAKQLGHLLDQVHRGGDEADA